MHGRHDQSVWPRRSVLFGTGEGACGELSDEAEDRSRNRDPFPNAPGLEDMRNENQMHAAVINGRV